MRKGIALLITLMMIMAITITIGVGLNNTKKAQSSLNDENFLYQSRIILDDVLTLLKSSPELKEIANDESGDLFNMFLEQSSFIPFESSGYQVAIEIKSARSKFNPSTLFSNDKKSLNLKLVNSLRWYFSNKMINQSYVDVLLDGLGGVREAATYNSDIFNYDDTLYRDSIVSKKHLDKFNEFYKDSFSDNSLKILNFNNLFYFCDDFNSTNSYVIDLNHATTELWELMLGADELRAQELALGAGYYSNDNKPELSDDEKLALDNFITSYESQKYLDVKVEVTQGENSAIIAFEYDIASKKGYNFSYEI